MATTKKETATPEAENIVPVEENTTPAIEEITPVEEAPATPKTDTKVEVYIPKGNVNDEPNLFVAVNGKSFLLPKGKKSMVPRYVYDEIMRSRKAEDIMDEHATEMASAQ